MGHGAGSEDNAHSVELGTGDKEAPKDVPVDGTTSGA
jgi:hypothetical protein